MTGRLVLVVGPSGVGKDSVLRYAMVRFAGDARFVFPRRCVTRPVDVAAEDHDSLDERTFDERASKGAFALTWEAHGHKYGVRSDIHAELQRGCIVAVNVSRTIIAEVAGRYQNAVVIEITADPSMREARLAARGREAADDIQQRTRREVATPTHPLPHHVVRNDGEISDAGDEFCRLLASLNSQLAERIFNTLLPAVSQAGRSRPPYGWRRGWFAIRPPWRVFPPHR